MSQNMIARQRLCLTADQSELVDAGDERAAFLYATPGDEIPAEMAAKFGLIDGALPGFDAEADVAPIAAEQAAAAAKADAEALAELKAEEDGLAAKEAEAAADEAAPNADAAADEAAANADPAPANITATKPKQAVKTKPKAAAETKDA